jgi:ubiquinone/menaquinone biosynthesis C-methylase UbiE
VKERVYRYRALERRLVEARPGALVLDVGCGSGENLVRLVRYGARARGCEPGLERARRAAARAPALAARGEALPWRDASFELVYLSHVLHHAADVGAVLREAHRVLAPGGALFVVESVDDSPLLRVARRLRPSWEGDPVRSRFRRRDLARAVERAGFAVAGGAPFNWIFFAWELLPRAFPPLGCLTPLWALLERAGEPLLGRFGAHCWLVASKPGPPLWPGLQRLESL